MQLDKTRVAIRERSFIDLLDLSLAVLREHAWPLALAWLVGAAPAALVNYWLLSDRFIPGAFDLSELPGYLFLLTLLTCWEIPLATAPMTLYLGQVLFFDRPDPARLIKDFFASLPQMLVYNVLPRLFVILIPFYFWFWPYLGEIILLERNPWKKRSPLGTSTLTRSGNMHSRNRGELFNRWFSSLMLGSLLIFVFWRSLWFLVRIIAGTIDDVAPQYTVCLPVAVWFVLGFFAIVRFLSYLDLRIRSEGWEVELLLRAEAARLARQIS